MKNKKWVKRYGQRVKRKSKICKELELKYRISRKLGKIVNG